MVILAREGEVSMHIPTISFGIINPRRACAGGLRCLSVRVCVTPFSSARGNSKARVRCQYIGNEVIN